MKNLITLLIITIITIVTLGSCSRNGDDQGKENIRLKTYGIGANEYDITYNTEGKPSGFETSSGNNIIIYNDHNQIIQMGNTTYTFNSQGRIATVIRSVRESTITYNNSGQIEVINSVFTAIGGTAEFSTSTLKYEGNKLKTIIENNINASPTYTKTTLDYDNNNNIIQKIINYSNDGITYEIEEINSFTYDTNINPMYNTLKKTGINTEVNLLRFIEFNYLGYNAYEGLRYYSKNNVLSSQKISNGTIEETNTYDYIYNDKNLPISAEHQVNKSAGGSLIEYYKWTYETY